MANSFEFLRKSCDIKGNENPYLKAIEYYTLNSVGSKLFSNQNMAQAIIKDVIENAIKTIEFVPDAIFNGYGNIIDRPLQLPNSLYCGGNPTLDEVISRVEENSELSCILASIGTSLVCEKDYDEPNSRYFKKILSYYFCSDFGSREYFKYAGKTFIKSTVINPLQNIILRELEMILGEPVMIMALKYGKNCFRSDINFAIKDTCGEDVIKMILDLDSLCQKYDLSSRDNDNKSKEDQKSLEKKIIKQYRKLQYMIIYVLATPEKRRTLAETGAYLNENGSHRIIDRFGEPEKRLSFEISEKLCLN